MPAAYYDLYGEEGALFVLKLNLLDKDGNPVNLVVPSLGQAVPAVYVPEELAAIDIVASEITEINAKLTLKSNLFTTDSVVLFETNPSDGNGTIILKDSKTNINLDHNILFHKMLTKEIVYLGVLEEVELVEPGIGMHPQVRSVYDNLGSLFTLNYFRKTNSNDNNNSYTTGIPYPKENSISLNYGVCDSSVASVVLARRSQRSGYTIGDIKDLNTLPGSIICPFYNHGSDIEEAKSFFLEGLLRQELVTDGCTSNNTTGPAAGEFITIKNNAGTGYIFTVTSVNTLNEYSFYNNGVHYRLLKTYLVLWNSLGYSYYEIKNLIAGGLSCQYENVATAEFGGTAINTQHTWQYLSAVSAFGCEYSNNNTSIHKLYSNSSNADPRMYGESNPQNTYKLSCDKNNAIGRVDKYQQCYCLWRMFDNIPAASTDERGQLPGTTYDLKYGDPNDTTSTGRYITVTGTGGKDRNGNIITDGHDLIRYTKPQVRVTNVSSKEISILGSHFYDLELNYTVLKDGVSQVYTIRMMQGKFTISPEVSD